MVWRGRGNKMQSIHKFFKNLPIMKHFIEFSGGGANNLSHGPVAMFAQSVVVFT